MRQLTDFLNKHILEIFLLIIIWNVGFILVQMYRRRNLPTINPSDIVYEETFVSGSFHRPLFKFFGVWQQASLNIKFLKDKILIGRQFPFCLYEATGHEIEIKYTDIVECSKRDLNRIQLKFNTPKGIDEFGFGAKNPQKVLSLCQRRS